MGVYIKKDDKGTDHFYGKKKINGEWYHFPIPAGDRKQADKLFKKAIARIQKKLKEAEGGITFRQFAQRYLKIKEGEKRKSIKHIQQLINKCVEYFGDRPLKSIKKMDVQDFIVWLRNQKTHSGKPPSDSTINRYLAQLKNLLNEAVDNDLIDKSPAQKIKFFDERKFARDKVITAEDFSRLVDAAAAHLKVILLVAYYTGMRLGEILGLTWDKVDLQEKMIYLNAEDTKTNEAREVPINDFLYDVFLKLKTGMQDGCPHVFTYEGKQILEIKRSFNSACRRAGIEDFHFHDLRHTFVTNARRAGVHDQTIMKITGHKTLEMFRRYNCVDRNDLRNGVNSIFKKNSAEQVEPGN